MLCSALQAGDVTLSLVEQKIEGPKFPSVGGSWICWIVTPLKMNMLKPKQIFWEVWLVQMTFLFNPGDVFLVASR